MPRLNDTNLYITKNSDKPESSVRSVDKNNVRRSRSGKVGEVVSVKSSSFFRNIKANANKELLKTLAWGAGGALLYPLVPTLLQSITDDDWSGYKGLFTGVGLAALLGLALGKPAITVGACSAAGTHLLYSKGTGFIERNTGTQIFRMNPENILYENDNLTTTT